MVLITDLHKWLHHCWNYVINTFLLAAVLQQANTLSAHKGR